MVKSTLKVCVETLTEIQRRTHGELEPSVAAELNDVIVHLRFLLEADDDDIRLEQQSNDKVLLLIAQLLDRLLKICAIIHRFVE